MRQGERKRSESRNGAREMRRSAWGRRSGTPYGRGERGRMVVVPAGAFRMGCVSGQDCQDDDSPVHRETIGAPFVVGVYEVAFAEWDTDRTISVGGEGGDRRSM